MRNQSLSSSYREIWARLMAKIRHRDYHKLWYPYTHLMNQNHIFYWSRVDLQCLPISAIAKWISYTHIYILFYCHSVAQSCCISVQFSSVTQSCMTLCDPMDCRSPSFPVLHYFLNMLFYLPLTETWVQPESIILSEVSQKEKCHMISLMCGI